MRELLEQTAERAISYLETLGDRSVLPPAEAVAKLAALDEPFNDAPVAPEQVIKSLGRDLLPGDDGDGGRALFRLCHWRRPAGRARRQLARRRLGSKHGSVHADARHFSIGAGCFELAPRSVCAAAGLWWRLLLPVQRWQTSRRLAAARHALLRREGWNVEADGLFGAPVITVVVGRRGASHAFQVARPAGLGRNRVVKVPVDSQGRMRADALPAFPILRQLFVCRQAM